MAQSPYLKQTLMPMNSLPKKPQFLSYKILAYSATTLTGLCALAAQVIWQKHLAILIGSEARSVSLVVAMFLSGLAGGYYLFGLLTERKSLSRSKLLKYYGYVELLTGAYIGFFPFHFQLLKALSFNSPNFLFIDILITVLALLLPTVLMGASIPMLTAGLPNRSGEVHNVHAKVYGWNTFGACFGALISGFYFIPAMGLNFSLHIIGIINILASLVFIGNQQEGPVEKQEELKSASSPLTNTFFILFVFLTGAIAISLEVILVRVLNLSIGAEVYNFPIILSIFVGGLALGSLSIKRSLLSLDFFVRQLFIILVLLKVLFFTAPYWSIWMSHIRVSLTSLPSNYLIYHILIFLFLLLFLFPVVFFMGRLLPLSYMFLNKTKQNYGKVCGQLYFFNSAGSVFGAVVLGYLAFYFFNLDIILKSMIYTLFLLTLVFIIYKKSLLNYILLGILGLILLALPTQWNRSGHEIGYFRIQQNNPNIHFKKLFFLPKNRIEQSHVSFFKDGPNSTVSLIHYIQNQTENVTEILAKLFAVPKKYFSSYSIVVNGKSDGNSLGDFSTVFFMLPYLHAPDKKNLKSVFVGLGTGLSAGAYAPLKDIESVDVLEISPFVIKAIQTVRPELNFNVMNDSKVKVIETDAFKHFTRYNKKYDIIVSEPSNPWVTGVENLYTTEFYELTAKNLNPGGIFGQWIHSYDMDLETLEIVLKTIYKTFPYAALYKVGHRDILIVASQERLRPLSAKKFNSAFVKKFYKPIGIHQVQDLYLSRILSEKDIHQLARFSPVSINSLIFPQLIYRASKARFRSLQANPFMFSNKLHLYEDRMTEKMKIFNKRKAENWTSKCLPIGGFSFLCANMTIYKNNWTALNNEKAPYTQRFAAYLLLRRHGLIPYNKEIMDMFFKKVLQKKSANLDQLSEYIHEKIKRKQYAEGDRDARAFKKHKIIMDQHYDNFRMDLQRIQKAHQALEALPADWSR